ncbi:hypothetical protein KQI52_10150 [bacterium]|nr:hypothetical protein [bacterium]
MNAAPRQRRTRNTTRKLTPAVLVVVLLLVLFSACEESSVPTGIQEYEHALNGYFVLEIVGIEVHDLGSTSDGYVFVGGEVFDSGEGWVGRFGPDGKYLMSWEFPAVVTGVIPVSLSEVLVITEDGQATMMRGGNKVWSVETTADRGLIRDDGTFILASYESTDQSVHLMAVSQDSTVLWQVTEPAERSMFAITTDAANRVVLAVYKDEIEIGPVLTLQFYDQAGHNNESIILFAPEFVGDEISMAATRIDTYVIVGTVIDQEDNQMAIIEFLPNGGEEWSHLHVHTTSSQGKAIAVTEDGSLVALGINDIDGDWNSHVVQLQFDLGRELLDERSYGSTISDNDFHEMILMDDGRMQLLGETGTGKFYIERDDL